MFWIRTCGLRNISGMETNVNKATTATALHCTPLNGKKLLHPWCTLALNPLTIVIFLIATQTACIYTSQRNQLASMTWGMSTLFLCSWKMNLGDRNYSNRPSEVGPQSLSKRTFCGIVCVVTFPFWHFCWCRGFCHRTESDLFRSFFW